MNYKDKKYLFCGVGGSGMSALAVAMLSRGANVLGSDRNYDRGLFSDHYQNLINKGVTMSPQDGTGVSHDLDALVVSSAVEPSIPDVRAAQDKNIPIIKRAELLAELSNSAYSITVGGTNGKSTVTAMIGWVLSDCGFDPTILNGGGMLNFDRENAVIGKSETMVLETDESDGSITNFHPDIAVLTNISEDHKSMDELMDVFGTYLSQSKNQVLNIDCPNVRALATQFPDAVQYSLSSLRRRPESKADVDCGLRRNDGDELNLIVPGRHNISNALAALEVAKICEVNEAQAIKSLNHFKGVVSRLEVIGRTDRNMTVIDDFGHNPDKIGASLATLKEEGRRLILMYQPHGFTPTLQQKDRLINVFSQYLDKNDVFYMPEIFYAGGTVEKLISSRDIIQVLKEKGLKAHFFDNKSDIQDEIIKNAQENDTICIMGARDDGLRAMARAIYKGLK
jgi:UDP-N-acetylmuramate--alanine ligase